MSRLPCNDPGKMLGKRLVDDILMDEWGKLVHAGNTNSILMI